LPPTPSPPPRRRRRPRRGHTSTAAPAAAPWLGGLRGRWRPCLSRSTRSSLRTTSGPGSWHDAAAGANA